MPHIPLWVLEAAYYILGDTAQTPLPSSMKVWVRPKAGRKLAACSAWAIWSRRTFSMKGLSDRKGYYVELMPGPQNEITAEIPKVLDQTTPSVAVIYTIEKERGWDRERELSVMLLCLGGDKEPDSGRSVISRPELIIMRWVLPDFS